MSTSLDARAVALAARAEFQWQCERLRAQLAELRDSRGAMCALCAALHRERDRMRHARAELHEAHAVLEGRATSRTENAAHEENAASAAPTKPHA